MKGDAGKANGSLGIEAAAANKLVDLTPNTIPCPRDGEPPHLSN